MSLLVRPFDGKPDNFLVVNSSPPHLRHLSQSDALRPFLWLFSVGNDLAFLDHVVDRTVTARLTTIIFCLNQMLNVVDDLACKNFLRMKPKKTLRVWAQLIEIEKNRLRILFNAQDCAELRQRFESLDHDVAITGSVLDLLLSPYTITRLLERWLRIQQILTQNPQSTHLELLCAIEPLLGRIYEYVLTSENSSLTPISRYTKISKSLFNIESGQFPTLMQSKMTLSTLVRLPQIPSSKLSELKEKISYDLTSELEFSLSILQGDEKELANLLERDNKRFQHLSGYLQEEVLKVIRFPDDETKQQKLLETIQRGISNKSEEFMIRHLALVNCTKLTSQALRTMTESLPLLQILDLSGCSNVSHVFAIHPEGCQFLRELRLDRL